MSLCRKADIPAHFSSGWPKLQALGAAYTLGGRVADALPLLTEAVDQTTAMAKLHYEIFCWSPVVTMISCPDASIAL